MAVSWFSVFLNCFGLLDLYVDGSSFLPLICFVFFACPSGCFSVCLMTRVICVCVCTDEATLESFAVPLRLALYLSLCVVLFQVLVFSFFGLILFLATY